MRLPRPVISSALLVVACGGSSEAVSTSGLGGTERLGEAGRLGHHAITTAAKAIAPEFS
jgi:hypothetical protein